jgi:hypothetical protein
LKIHGKQLRRHPVVANESDPELERFNTAITAMLETHGQEATTARLYGYELGLSGIPVEYVELAVAKSLSGSKQLAKPAELREIATGGSAEAHAIAAWGEVQRAVTVSYMHDLDFEDRLINAVIRGMHGRQRFFSRFESADSEKWLRIDFMKAYTTLSKAGVSEEAAAMLIGEADHGAVKGRTHTPRIAVIKTETERPLLMPPREEVAVIDARPAGVPRVELKKS